MTLLYLRRRTKKDAFTIIELLIAVAIIGILLTMALPNFYRMRVTTREIICKNNLRQLEAAIDRWVFESDIDEGRAVSDSDEDAIYSYIRGGRPECPSGGTYTIGVIGTYPQVTCEIEGHSLVEE